MVNETKQVNLETNDYNPTHSLFKSPLNTHTHTRTHTNKTEQKTNKTNFSTVLHTVRY